MKKYKFLIFCLLIAAFCKGCYDRLTCSRIPVQEKINYIAIAKYKFEDKSLQRMLIKELKANHVTDELIHYYDVCYAKYPINRWDVSKTEIIDSTNLIIVSHHWGMSYTRDSIFPYLVKGVVQHGTYTFFFYDSISINRLLKPSNHVWYAHKMNEKRDEYIYTAGLLESEVEFYLNDSNKLHYIPRKTIGNNARYNFYFIENLEFESQNGLYRTENDSLL